MKKTQVALAALALVASTAALADVKMYGAADITVMRTKAGTVISPGDNVGSIFGIAASEDLGGGLKAGANLELGFNPGDGLMRNGGTQGAYNAVFNRAANVSIGTNDLTVKAGLQFSPFIGALAAGLNAVGGNGLNVPAMGVLGSYGAANPGGGFFIPNSVSVDFNAGGFNGTILRSMVSETAPTAAAAGVQASNGSTGAYTAARVSTAVSGINLTFGYESDKNLQATTPVDYNIYAIMASMPLTSELTINGGYTSRNQGNAADPAATSQTAYTVGASYQISQPLAVGLNYTANNATAKSTMLGLGTRYNFSKATALYLNYAKFENNVSGILQNGGQIDTVDAATPYNSTAIGLGLSHSF